MIPTKNYETTSTFGKVMQRKRLASFYPGHGVYVADFLFTYTQVPL